MLSLLRSSKMVKSYEPSVQTDSNPYDLRPSNSSKRPIELVDDGVRFNKDASFYDMNGDKFLIILNQHRFEKTKNFTRKPSTRIGTYNDERRLKEVFYELGFKIFVLRDLKYQNIINYLTAIATLGHTRTSCICVTILTHGDKGGQIFAADRPYQLRELIAIFEKEPTLTNKPKLFFVQACRGGSMDPGHTVPLGSQCDALTMPSSNFSFFNLFRDAGSTDRLYTESRSVLTVPSHADILVLCSTVEDYLSYRDKDGSWMIQALCDAIQDHHEDLNLLDMIIQMNRAVAYERKKDPWKVMNNEKQMPEARFTLTKQLKF